MYQVFSKRTKENLKYGAVAVFGLGVWFMPVPEGLKPEAWHLFAIFIAAIFAVVIDAMPIFTSSILALSAAVLTGTLNTQQAYSGFSQSFILLIVVAFLIARGVIKSGLGKRIADGTRKRLGAYLMMTSMAGITLSSTLWLTAMAANPAGAKMAEAFGVTITYGSWALAASLPVVVLYLKQPLPFWDLVS